MADRLRVVLADEPRACDDFQDILEHLGHEVVAVAHDGLQLARACRQYRPDLVIAEVKLPRHDGIWAAEAIDEESHTPVVLVSACHEPDLVNLTHATNIGAYLVKPVKSEDLEMAIAVALRKSWEIKERRGEAL